MLTHAPKQHVASDADSISIRVSSLNKEPVAVEVVGVCTQRDIALLRVVDPAGLRALVKGHTGSDQIHKLTLGDSDSVALGDKVVALGFPLGFNGVKITVCRFSSTWGVLTADSLADGHLFWVSGELHWVICFDFHRGFPSTQVFEHALYGMVDAAINPGLPFGMQNMC